MYVWLTLFVHHYTSRCSSIGLLAAAFGTNAFLQGCDDITETKATARVLVHMVVAIGVLIVTGSMFSMGRPSDLAYEAFVQAWCHCQSIMGHLFAIDNKEGGTDAADFDSFACHIAQAEMFAGEAANEHRLWRSPFPVDLFSNLTSLASWMRRQLICIHTVACVDQEKEDVSIARIGVKKTWFKAILETDGDWKNEVEVLRHGTDHTRKMVMELQAQNKGRRAVVSSGPPSEAALARTTHTGQYQRLEEDTLRVRPGWFQPEHDIEKRLCAKRDLTPQGATSLVEDEDVQRAIVAGCLESIRKRNFAVQVEMIGHQHQLTDCGI
ncbi:unnamed protein product [Prorocentrum cordatum]|uniref:Uncharacterized protein n=1 Tax=Prorocentrum cordatum TaxID=2364126 RepID=A0ABN9RIE0_9DINO|nr:unnamed protein product [Polarella glacialis]